MSTPPGSDCGSLLVVDDNEMNRDMLSRRLSRHGHAVRVADSGRAALELIDQHPFDIVLLDVTMPGIDGFETLSIVRQKHSVSDLRVIMATARDGSEDIVKALQLGANDYVTKPLDFPVVLARVQAQLLLKRAVDRIRELEQSLTRRNLELESANHRMKRDLDAAARIQQSGLPRTLPRTDRLSFAWAYHPCDELGGDSLNVMQLDDRHVGLYVLDVSGHGVPAALLAVTLNRQLSPTHNESSLLVEPAGAAPGLAVAPPARLADKLNRMFPMDLIARQFFTLLYGVVDVQTCRLRFVAAGHPGPIQVPAQSPPVAHDVPGFPVGIVAEAQYAEQEIQLQPGDRIYLYSDGIIEEQNGQGEMFGRQRLVDGLGETRGGDLNGSVHELLHRVRAWCAPNPVRDDLSILAMEVNA